MTINTFHSLWTIVLLIVFVGIIFWAWDGRRKQAFDEAALLPLDSDFDSNPDSESTLENDHG